MYPCTSLHPTPAYTVTNISQIPKCTSYLRQEPNDQRPRQQILIASHTQPSPITCTRASQPSNTPKISKLIQTWYNTWPITVRKSLLNSAMKSRLHIYKKRARRNGEPWKPIAKQEISGKRNNTSFFTKSNSLQATDNYLIKNHMYVESIITDKRK